MSKRIDERCKRCLKLNKTGECMAFRDIEYQHNRKGGCYGRVTDPNVMAKMYEDLADYTKEVTAAKKVYLREARLWRKRQHG